MWNKEREYERVGEAIHTYRLMLIPGQTCFPGDASRVMIINRSTRKAGIEGGKYSKQMRLSFQNYTYEDDVASCEIVQRGSE